MSHKIYKVGGCVRDKLLGVDSKDIDFVFVVDKRFNVGVKAGFVLMKTYMEEHGYTIFLSTPEMFTIRAKFPNDHQYKGMVADFVLARKEVGYIPGTRRPILEIGTLYDDLARRDFTVNAMAEDENGDIIDPFYGRVDLLNKNLRTPQSIEKSFDDDPLRILRAIRFSITKGLTIPMDMTNAIREYDYNSKMGVVSNERIREELYKCFKYDTPRTIFDLNRFHGLRDYIFTKTKLWLKPTFEQ